MTYYLWDVSYAPYWSCFCIHVEVHRLLVLWHMSFWLMIPYKLSLFDRVYVILINLIFVQPELLTLVSPSLVVVRVVLANRRIHILLLTNHQNNLTNNENGFQGSSWRLSSKISSKEKLKE